MILLAIGPWAAALIDRPAGLGGALALALLLIGAGLSIALVRSDRLARLGESGPVTTANVLGRLNPGAPRRLVVIAHHDTKSQPLSLIGRAVAVSLLLVGWLAVPIEAAAGAVWPGGLLARALDPLLLVAGAAGIVLAWGCGTWGNRSPGALDNGASVLCLLEAARRIGAAPPPDLELVVAFTGAEEHLMLGARRLVPWLGGADDGGRTTVINLDGVGEPGPVGIAGPTPLVRWLKESARRAGVDVRRVRFPPGSATDAVPLRRAGFPVVGLTSARLGPGARAVHTAGDRPEHVSPETLERVVRLLEAAVRGEEARR